MISSSMLPIEYVVLILFFVLDDKVDRSYTVHTPTNGIKRFNEKKI